MGQMRLGAVMTNCYLIWNDDTRETLIVDPADNGPAIVKVAKDNQLDIKAILLTHGHFDHMMAVPYLVEATGVPVYAGEKEENVLGNVVWNLSKDWAGKKVTIKADHWVKDGQILELAGFKIKVLETPGHTEGSICFYFEEEGQLFSGDTLFHGSYGRTDLPTGSAGTLFRSINEKLLVLPDEVIVYPGHNSATTIGFEKENNPAAGGF